MIKGACLCGGVRFEIDAKVSSFWLCHCSKCRRVSGGPFSAAALCRSRDFRFTAGQAEIRSYRMESGYTRTFCGTCGCPAPLVRKEEGSVILSPGTLDGASPDGAYRGELARHIFVGSNAPWWKLFGAAPQFEEHVPREEHSPREERPPE